MLTDSKIQEEILEDFEYETWEEYVTSNYRDIYTRYLRQVLNDYTPGFIQVTNKYLHSWGGLKGSYLSGRHTHDQNGKDLMLQQEADSLLRGKVILVIVNDSLYDKHNDHMYYESRPDNFFWIFDDKAIGLVQKQHFKIVDALGQSLDLLNIGVETRIVETIIGNIKTFEIQVMFDLVPLDE